jgi:DNA-directed RNA polymerase subunit beta'
MARFKAVQLLVNESLPQHMRDYNRALDANGIGNLMAQVARETPQDYGRIVKSIADIGRHASYAQGETLTLHDMEPVLDRDSILKEMDREVSELKKARLPEPDFKAGRARIWQSYADRLEKLTSRAALAQGNGLADSVVSGARGKPAQLKAMLTTPGIYEGADNLFIRHSFGEGLRPAEYLAGSYGARSVVLSTKRATAKGGYFGKQLAMASASQPVTMKDCGASNGIDLPIDDASLNHRVLARDTAGVEAGTIVDRRVLEVLRKAKVNDVIVRSAMTCQAPEGVCARCAGAGPTGKLPHVGESVGITAGQSVGEPMAQGALSAKHTAGQSSGKREFSGFDVINRFAQSPEVFEDRAVVAEKPGKVDEIKEAPQGGSYIMIGGHPHYSAPGYALTVKVGDHVESGDQLSDGLIDPGDIVRLKGIGPARRYYSERLKKILDDSGMRTTKRNTELIARSAINHVSVEDMDGIPGYLPGDVVPYETAAANYDPPADAKGMTPKAAVGMFLHAPALHYTIGTQLTPRIAEHLENTGMSPVFASATEPGFRPEMVGLKAAAFNNPDWIGQQHTSYIRKHLAEAAMSGADSQVGGGGSVHFAPRLAIGKDFGRDVERTGKF